MWAAASDDKLAAAVSGAAFLVSSAHVLALLVWICLRASLLRGWLRDALASISRGSAGAEDSERSRLLGELMLLRRARQWRTSCQCVSTVYSVITLGTVACGRDVLCDEGAITDQQYALALASYLVSAFLGHAPESWRVGTTDRSLLLSYSILMCLNTAFVLSADGTASTLQSVLVFATLLTLFLSLPLVRLWPVALHGLAHFGCCALKVKTSGGWEGSFSAPGTTVILEALGAVATLYFCALLQSSVESEMLAELKASSLEADVAAVKTALRAACDAVVELDGDLHITRHEDALAKLLFWDAGSSLQGTSICHLGFGDADAGLLAKHFRKPDASADTAVVQVGLRDSNWSMVRVELFRVPLSTTFSQEHYLVGVRELWGPSDEPGHLAEDATAAVGRPPRLRGAPLRNDCISMDPVVYDLPERTEPDTCPTLRFGAFDFVVRGCIPSSLTLGTSTITRKTCLLEWLSDTPGNMEYLAEHDQCVQRLGSVAELGGTGGNRAEVFDCDWDLRDPENRTLIYRARVQLSLCLTEHAPSKTRLPSNDVEVTASLTKITQLSTEGSTRGRLIRAGVTSL